MRGCRRWGAMSLIACMLLLFIRPILSIEAKCSACRAVANALSAKAERPSKTMDLDLRARLDGNGVRYGKKIPYK